MNSLKELLTRSVSRLLTPLVRILVHYGFTHKEFSDLAKHVYVDVCEKYFSIDNKKVTTSRIAVLTGLNRKEVLRVKENSEKISISAIPVNRATRVIGGWLSHKEFTNKNGEPKVLNIVDGELSFKNLVKLYSGDITYGAILEELMRVGAVELVDDDHVRLVKKGYVPKNSETEKMALLGKSVAHHIETIHHNMLSNDTPHFQREVLYTDLPESTIKAFEHLMYEKSLTLLVELNQWLAEQKSSAEGAQVDKNTSKDRIGLGLYYIRSRQSPNQNDGE